MGREEVLDAEEEDAETVKHPAKFSWSVVDAAEVVLKRWAFGAAEGLGFIPTVQVLDPFAGVGRVHELSARTPDLVCTKGVEIEPEWAACHPATLCGDSTDLPFEDGTFDAVFTSPVYGNRMSDHYQPKDTSTRHSYRGYLGRDLAANNTGRMQWGRKYRDTHKAVWGETVRVLRDGGLFLLNVKDHQRNHARVRVSKWHQTVLGELGIEWLEEQEVEAPGMRHGENSDARYPEMLYVGIKGGWQ